MSGIVNKIKEAVHSDKSTTHSAPEGSHGPHNTRVANAADPRVDSDRDGSHNMGASRTAGQGGFGSHGIGSTGTHTGAHTGAHTGTHNVGTTGRTAGHGEFGSANPFSSTGTTGTHNTHGTVEGAHGPHSSRLANAADPRVDSDRDGSHTVGQTGNTFGSTGTHGAGQTHGLGQTGNHGIGSTGNHGIGSTGNHGIGSTGTHTGTHGLGGNTSGFSSADARSGYGAGSGTTGMTGTHGAPTGTHGPHSSRVANAADPRVDSDRDGRSAFNSSGPGPAPHTAGPHNSDMMNKMDPRVDSDLDGSKTFGGNTTYNQSGVNHNNLRHKDPTDAAQVPPSVLQQHIGAPVIGHDDHSHNRERRNSTQTHQETHRGI
ncbi:hypothetical protein B0T25DRAFT_565229 [Lasiosphaeria hispida]|uniref:Cell surface protein n=1 Tax=Lasiosphaeria hispida TaxID=260671 RepID=A0AAJ0HRW5_9PEZI|nr:hypothetical protein B0T25DRAFT_565229 [Lasiosphaeria hispida]